MTIQQARKILGKLAEGVTDEELERDIKVADMLKSLFFSQQLNRINQQLTYNKNSNGKA